jgi:hypothetical protein
VARALAKMFSQESPELAAMVHTTAAVTQVRWPTDAGGAAAA